MSESFNTSTSQFKRYSILPGYSIAMKHNSHFSTDVESISDQDIAQYQENGFYRVRGIISPEEAEAFRKAADRVLKSGKDEQGGHTVFRQYVNTWRIDDELKKLALHSTVARVASKLAGVRLRLWHDHLLVKEPTKSTPTHFHQDQPFWPHDKAPNPLSCWIALNDVPVERGCMTFIPGSNRMTDLSAQDLNDAGSLFSVAPELAWDERVTLPLKAGDCTFHHGRTAHMANANESDQNRYGFVIIFMDATATYTGLDHAVTDPLRDSGKLKVGDPLTGDLFPEVS